MKMWQQFQSLSKTLKRFTYAVLAVAVYALIGFLLLPLIVQPLLVDTLNEKLNRKASIESIKINPFALSVSINKLSVAGKHTQQLFGFEQLVVNFQALGVFRQVIGFDEISIVRPNMKIIVLKSGGYNFDDIIKKFSAAEGAENIEPQENIKDESWSVAIDKFRYVEGSVYFEDRNRATEFKSQIESLSISLDDFSTRPGDGNLHHIKAQTLRGTTVDWTGEFSLSPLKSQGHIELLGDLMVVSDYMQEQMRIKIKQGKLSVKSDYDFKLLEGESIFNINNMLAAIEDLDVRRKDDSKVVAWKQVSLNLAELDLINKKLVINNIATTDIAVEINKDKKTNVDFADLFVLQNLAESGEASAANASDAGADQKWDVSITEINNENLDVNLLDQSVSPAVLHHLKFIDININDLKPFTDEQANFLVALKINDNGRVDITGKAQPASKLIDLNLRTKSIALKDYQSYINNILRIDILKGDFGSDLNIKIDASADIAKLNVNGDIDISSLTLRDKKLKEKFLSWKRLSVKYFSFEYPEQKIDISDIDVNKPYLRLVMNGGGETNIQKLMIENKASQNNKPAVVQGEKSDFKAAIKNISIRDAKMDFSDSSLSPNFSAGIYHLKGNVSGLSSKQLSKARVDLKGKVDKYAPVTIKGDINPLTKDKYTEIEMLFKGIELTTFTPYSGKFAGYEIEKGKLSLDLKYKLSKNELVAENGVVLDQLTLGEATDSEDATSLPLNFALSLLKDSNGVIDIDLPIRGNINDPDFKYGSLVWGALGNLITGIVSSPFKALANLAGGDAEGLDYIVFSANSAELTIPEKNKLDLLAKALLQRPELHLEIRGVSSSLIDHDEMAYLKVRKKLKLKPETLSIIATQDDRDELVDYYEKITKLTADELLPKKHKLSSEQAEKLVFDKALKVVLNKTEVTELEFELLAKQRAGQIQQYLIDVGKVSADNIFLLDSNINLANEFENVKDSSLQLPLGLKAK